MMKKILFAGVLMMLTAVSALAAPVTVRTPLADARVNRERGVVICSSDVLPLISSGNAALEAVFGPQSYHGGDYAFYFDSVRENVRNRVNNYLKNQ